MEEWVDINFYKKREVIIFNGNTSSSMYNSKTGQTNSISKLFDELCPLIKNAKGEIIFRSLISDDGISNVSKIPYEDLKDLARFCYMGKGIRVVK